MSAQNQVHDTEAQADGQEETLEADALVDVRPSGTQDLDDKFEQTTRSARKSNTRAREAFDNYEYKPSVTTTRGEGWLQFQNPAFEQYGSTLHTYQWPNGAGLVEHETRGLQRYRLPSGDRLRGLSAEQVRSIVRTMSDTYIDDVIAQHRRVDKEEVYSEFRDEMVMRTNRSDHFVLQLINDTLIVVLRDASAGRNGARYAGLVVEPDDPRYSHVLQLLARDDYEHLADIVAPPAVLASEMPVVTSTDYRSSDREPAHVGGYYDEEQLGDVIIRQGEWYFVPTELDNVGDDEIRKVLSEYREQSSTYGVTQELPDNPLGSHVARDVVERDGEVYVRGTVRHLDNEHTMFNVRERWHRVLENTADMFVFDDGGGRVE